MPYAVRVDKIKRGATRIKMYLVIHTVYTAILRSTDKASGELREKKGVVNRVVTPYTTDDTSNRAHRSPQHRRFEHWVRTDRATEVMPGSLSASGSAPSASNFNPIDCYPNLIMDYMNLECGRDQESHRVQPRAHTLHIGTPDSVRDCGHRTKGKHATEACRSC